jgi:hypothetical protein
MNKTIISKSKTFELTLPENFSYEENENRLSIYSEKGYGAINISSYLIPKDYRFDEIKELKDFVHSIDKKINFQDLKINKDKILTSEFVTVKQYWKIWVFFQNYKAIFVTYNCEEENKQEEIEKINLIVQSIRIW